MSDEKRQQLIAEGKLREDGSRIERCPLCLREFAPGEGLPEPPEGSAVAEAEPANPQASGG